MNQIYKCKVFSERIELDVLNFENLKSSLQKKYPHKIILIHGITDNQRMLIHNQDSFQQYSFSGFNILEIELIDRNNPQSGNRRTERQPTSTLGENLTLAITIIKQLVQKITILKKQIHDLQSKADNIEKVIYESKIIKKPSFSRTYSKTCETTFVEVNRYMLERDPTIFIANIKLTNTSGIDWKKGITIHNKSSKNNIVELVRRTLPEIKKGETIEIPLTFKILKKIKPDIVNKEHTINACIKDSSQFQIKETFPIIIYFFKDVAEIEYYK